MSRLYLVGRLEAEDVLVVPRFYCQTVDSAESYCVEMLAATSERYHFWDSARVRERPATSHPNQSAKKRRSRVEGGANSEVKVALVFESAHSQEELHQLFRLSEKEAHTIESGKGDIWNLTTSNLDSNDLEDHLNSILDLLESQRPLLDSLSECWISCYGYSGGSEFRIGPATLDRLASVGLLTWFDVYKGSQ